MTVPPGKVGFPLVHDDSLRFWRDPFGYVQQKVSKHGTLFQARVLNGSTTFITTYEDAEYLLGLPEDTLSAGDAYEFFMSDVYGSSNVILASGGTRANLLKSLHAFFATGFQDRLEDQLSSLVHCAQANLVWLLDRVCCAQGL